MITIDSSIIDFYTQSSEETRLQSGLGPLEFLRNKELIARYLGAKPLDIADVGGGTGHYADWLSSLGHKVTLIDPVEKHIQKAKNRAKRSNTYFSVRLGEARSLPLETSSMDLVILHGPLYHLLTDVERIAALKEAGRVLKVGGIVLGFAITHSAFTIAALQNGMIHNSDIFDMCQEELLTGIHNPPSAFPGILAQAYFHKPTDLSIEFKRAGFQTKGIFAVEGIAWLDVKFFESWAIPEKRQRLMQLIKLIETDTNLFSLSPHLMVVAEVDYGDYLC